MVWGGIPLLLHRWLGRRGVPVTLKKTNIFFNSKYRFFNVTNDDINLIYPQLSWKKDLRWSVCFCRSFWAVFLSQFLSRWQRTFKINMRIKKWLLCLLQRCTGQEKGNVSSCCLGFYPNIALYVVQRQVSWHRDFFDIFLWCKINKIAR